MALLHGYPESHKLLSHVLFIQPTIFGTALREKYSVINWGPLNWEGKSPNT